MSETNWALGVNGASVVAVSHEASQVSSTAANLLDECEDQLWITGDAPQYVTLRLDPSHPPLFYAGWHVWHDYLTNPKRVEIASGPSEVALTPLFVGQALPGAGTQVWKAPKPIPPQHCFVRFTILETFGPGPTYLNNVVLLAKDPGPHYYGSTSATTPVPAAPVPAFYSSSTTAGAAATAATVTAGSATPRGQSSLAERPPTAAALASATTMGSSTTSSTRGGAGTVPYFGRPPQSQQHQQYQPQQQQPSAMMVSPRPAASAARRYLSEPGPTTSAEEAVGVFARPTRSTVSAPGMHGLGTPSPGGGLGGTNSGRMSQLLRDLDEDIRSLRPIKTVSPTKNMLLYVPQDTPVLLPPHDVEGGEGEENESGDESSSSSSSSSLLEGNSRRKRREHRDHRHRHRRHGGSDEEGDSTNHAKSSHARHSGAGSKSRGSRLGSHPPPSGHAHRSHSRDKNSATLKTRLPHSPVAAAPPPLSSTARDSSAAGTHNDDYPQQQQQQQWPVLSSPAAESHAAPFPHGSGYGTLPQHQPQQPFYSQSGAVVLGFHSPSPPPPCLSAAATGPVYDRITALEQAVASLTQTVQHQREDITMMKRLLLQQATERRKDSERQQQQQLTQHNEQRSRDDEWRRRLDAERRDRESARAAAANARSLVTVTPSSASSQSPSAAAAAAANLRLTRHHVDVGFPEDALRGFVQAVLEEKLKKNLKRSEAKVLGRLDGYLHEVVASIADGVDERVRWHLEQFPPPRQQQQQRQNTVSTQRKAAAAQLPLPASFVIPVMSIDQTLLSSSSNNGVAGGGFSSSTPPHPSEPSPPPLSGGASAASFGMQRQQQQRQQARHPYSNSGK